MQVCVTSDIDIRGKFLSELTGAEVQKISETTALLDKIRVINNEDSNSAESKVTYNYNFYNGNTVNFAIRSFVISCLQGAATKVFTNKKGWVFVDIAEDENINEEDRKIDEQQEQLTELKREFLNQIKEDLQITSLNEIEGIEDIIDTLKDLPDILVQVALSVSTLIGYLTVNTELADSYGEIIIRIIRSMCKLDSNDSHTESVQTVNYLYQKLDKITTRIRSLEVIYGSLEEVVIEANFRDKALPMLIAKSLGLENIESIEFILNTSKETDSVYRESITNADINIFITSDRRMKTKRNQEMLRIFTTLDNEPTSIIINLKDDYVDDRVNRCLTEINGYNLTASIQKAQFTQPRNTTKRYSTKVVLEMLSDGKGASQYDYAVQATSFGAHAPTKKSMFEEIFVVEGKRACVEIDGDVKEGVETIINHPASIVSEFESKAEYRQQVQEIGETIMTSLTSENSADQELKDTVIRVHDEAYTAAVDGLMKYISESIVDSEDYQSLIELLQGEVRGDSYRTTVTEANKTLEKQHLNTSHEGIEDTDLTQAVCKHISRVLMDTIFTEINVAKNDMNTQLNSAEDVYDHLNNNI